MLFSSHTPSLAEDTAAPEYHLHFQSSITCRLSMSERTLFTAHQWNPPLHSTRLSTLVFLLVFWPRLAYLERLLRLVRLARWSSLSLLGRTLFFFFFFFIIVLVVVAHR